MGCLVLRPYSSGDTLSKVNNIRPVPGRHRHDWTRRRPRPRPTSTHSSGMGGGGCALHHDGVCVTATTGTTICTVLPMLWVAARDGPSPRYQHPSVFGPSGTGTHCIDTHHHQVLPGPSLSLLADGDGEGGGGHDAGGYPLQFLFRNFHKFLFGSGTVKTVDHYGCRPDSPVCID